MYTSMSLFLKFKYLQMVMLITLSDANTWILLILTNGNIIFTLKLDRIYSSPYLPLSCPVTGVVGSSLGTLVHVSLFTFFLRAALFVTRFLYHLFSFPHIARQTLSLPPSLPHSPYLPLSPSLLHSLSLSLPSFPPLSPSHFL